MRLEDYIHSDATRDEVAVVHLRHPETKREIDLVGAVHIGSQGYYADAQKVLAGCDAVLYEWITNRKEKLSLRNHLIFSNYIKDGDLYRGIVQAINEKRIRYVSSFLDAIAPFLDVDYLEASAAQLSQEIPELVYQGDAIDYNHLPLNWHHADLTNRELSSLIKIFSKDNLSFLGLKLFSGLLSQFPKFRDKAAKKLVSADLSPTDLGNRFMSRINHFREAKVYEQVARLEKDPRIKRIGIFYGVGHLPALESGLQECSYLRTSLDFLEIFRPDNSSFQSENHS